LNTKDIFENSKYLEKTTIKDLNLLTNKQWEKDFELLWEPGEEIAKTKLNKFISEKIKTYKENRDIPISKASSCLSPYLAFGEISPIQIWNKVSTEFKKLNLEEKESGPEVFLSEIGKQYSIIKYGGNSFHTFYILIKISKIRIFKKISINLNGKPIRHI
jgi:deoxyribodipyrimidine photolyase